MRPRLTRAEWASFWIAVAVVYLLVVGGILLIAEVV